MSHRYVLAIAAALFALSVVMAVLTSEMI